MPADDLGADIQRPHGNRAKGETAAFRAIPSFCIVVPMYNERENAERCVASFHSYLAGIQAQSGIIAVDDGSSDGTGEVLKELSSRYPELMIETHKRNIGYGGANRTGFARAVREQFDYALVMDADLTQDPIYIAAFFEPMRAGVDFIKATRYDRGGRAEGVPLKRVLISWIGNRLAQVVLRCGLTDFTNGFRAIRTGFLPRLNTHENDFAVLMEEVYQARRQGATFAEVPYTLTVRDDGSTSKFNYSWKVYWTYLRYLFPLSRR
jgi:dolichol-phosphate mannosyltransferase